VTISRMRDCDRREPPKHWGVAVSRHLRISAAFLSLGLVFITGNSAVATCDWSDRSPAIRNIIVNDVGAADATHAWAVGNRHGRYRLLQWDGLAWTKTTLALNEIMSDLHEVEAVAADQAWVVGTYQTANAKVHALIGRWDGATWSNSPLPNLPSGNLWGVASLDTTDAWAVGWTVPGGAYNKGVTLHWNGSAWTRITSAGRVGGESQFLFGVDAVAHGDVWAVGQRFTETGPSTALIEHWNGTAWSRIPSPHLAGDFSYLQDVKAFATDDVWAVGLRENGARILVEHWNGTRWKVVPTPNVPKPGALTGIDGTSSSNLWVVGYRGRDPILMHQEAGVWSVEAVPGTGNRHLYGVDVVSGTDVWAGGVAGSTAFVIHGCG
jgi:hypothetical protein